jgi:hypothetical protein
MVTLGLDPIKLLFCPSCLYRRLIRNERDTCRASTTVVLIEIDKKSGENQSVIVP